MMKLKVNLTVLKDLVLCVELHCDWVSRLSLDEVDTALVGFDTGVPLTHGFSVSRFV